MFNSQIAKNKMQMIKIRKKIRLLSFKLIWIKTGIKKVLLEPSYKIAKKILKIITLIDKINSQIKEISILRKTTLKTKIKKNLLAIKMMMKTSTNWKKSKWNSGNNSNKKKPLEKSSDYHYPISHHIHVDYFLHLILYNSALRPNLYKL